MEVDFVDRSGREIPFSEGSKILKVLGFGEVLTAVSTSSAYAPEDAVGELAALGARQYTVRARYDKETGKWVVSVSARSRGLEVELAPYKSVSDELRWKAVVKLPCEWFPGLAVFVDAIDAVAEQMREEMQALREELEQLKTRLAQAQPQAARPATLPDARRIARALHELADALHEIADAAEEEEEEDEW